MAVTFLGRLTTVKSGIIASEDIECVVQLKFNHKGQEDIPGQLNHMLNPQRGVYVVIFDEHEYDTLKGEGKIVE